VSTKAYREAVEYALTLGLVDAGWDGKGHHVFRNPANGAISVISSSMPDRTRALWNTKAALRRTAGVDSRGQESVEGERRERRRLGRLGSGFNLDAAVRELRSRPAAPPRQTRDDLAAEREALYLELLSLETRDARAEQLAARIVELDQRLAAS
jgi:hypothetical protein